MTKYILQEGGRLGVSALLMSFDFWVEGWSPVWSLASGLLRPMTGYPG